MMRYKPRPVTVEHLNWLYLIFNTDLPMPAKLIAAYLNTYMNANRHKAWPSVGRIMQDCSMAKNTVLAHSKTLENEGWLVKVPGGRINGVNVTSTYKMAWPPEISVELGVQEMNHGGSGDAPHGVQEMNPNQKDKSETKRKRKATPKVDPLEAVINDKVNPEAWREWWEFKGGKYAQATITKNANLMAQYSSDVQQKMVDKAIQKDWKGLYEPTEDMINGNRQSKANGGDQSRLATILTADF